MVASARRQGDEMNPEWASLEAHLAWELWHLLGRRLG
jgi:hypothetical protein